MFLKSLRLPVIAGLVSTAALAEPIDGLLGHWRLAGDLRDYSGHNRHAENHGAVLTAEGPDGRRGTAAGFDGRRAWIEVPGNGIPFGRANFTIAVRIYTERVMDDVPGDILSQFDPIRRQGVNLGLLSLPGSVGSQPNDRNITFGIDNGILEPAWTDHGPLGHAVFVFGLAVHDGSLYAATCERGPEERGRVYRLDRENGWVDCGAPDASNAVTSLAVFDGELYAGTGRYQLRGSALPETRNQEMGGRVFRYRGEGRWESCGRVSAETEAIGGMVVFRGQLYASSAYPPAGLFRFEGGERWTALGTSGDRMLYALGVHNGLMYASCWNGGNVITFDGGKFTDLGRVDQSTQTYGFVTLRGQLYVSTWPFGRMYRYGGGSRWADAGRLGDEKEAMGTALYNGKAYVGSLPLAKVYRYERDSHTMEFRYERESEWTDLGQVDDTPDVKYRRAWSMAVYNGRLFVGTLPKGRVYSIEAGRNATVDRPLAPGWRHVAAVRRASRLEVFVDGQKAAESAVFDPEHYDLSVYRPLRIGAGENDYFNGRLADLRIYGRALAPEEVQTIAR